MSDPRERYWRRLDELLGRPELQDALAREFPPAADLPPGALTRRSFVRLLGASLALAGISGCVRRPRQKILPYVARPPEMMPSAARHYATSMTLGGYATGLLVESHTGRPTKIEGNPDHPASLGAAGVFEQASVLGLYDPQRAQSVRRAGRRSTWEAFAAAIGPADLPRTVGARGAGLHLLLEPSASPLRAELLARVRERYPDARIHVDAPLANNGERTGTAAAFGRAVQPVYDFAAADVVLALDADFLHTMPFHLRYARDFASRRRIASPSDEMNRLYMVETAPTVTGGAADHRLRARPTEIPALVAGLARRIARAAPALAVQLPRSVASGRDGATPHEPWLTAVADDLLAHRGGCAIVAGERQPAAVHALAHLLNAALDGDGHTVRYIEPPLAAAESDTGLAQLAAALRAGEVAWLMVLDGNPAYTAPADLDVAALLGRARESAYLGPYRNETARACGWFLPAQHYLESWDDGRAWDGTASLVQPLLEPLYGGHAPADVLAALAGDPTDAHTALQESWRRRLPTRDFPQAWDEMLQRGVAPDSAAPPIAVRPSREGVPDLFGDMAIAASAPGRLELALVPDAAVYDGRFGNNPWLQELPDPITKLTWGNAALLSPATAARLGVESGRLVELVAGGRKLTIPALVAPGHADDAVTVALGYGRAAHGRGDGDEQVAAGVGANGYRLRTMAEPFAPRDVSLRPLGNRAALAITQGHWKMDGRPLALAATLTEFRRQPIVAPHQRGKPLSLYEPAPATAPDQWAMTIDLAACTGCSACVVACQAENNVPVVGPEGVRDSREMHWLRIDRYFAGTPDDPVALSQPMLCQQCEKAPCEYVCPVSATVHSPDGINEMVYNRCVGTRFCSNNCPYKVRRFNWFDYNAEVSETERLAKNPDVTVRARGVMEKCTFCVQRIREAQITARLEDRGLRSGDVRTACQQACPSRAIVFGSLTDPEGEVTRWRDHPRAYSVLHELGTEPRVRYLARITNPNPRLETGAG